MMSILLTVCTWIGALVLVSFLIVMVCAMYAAIKEHKSGVKTGGSIYPDPQRHEHLAEHLLRQDTVGKFIVIPFNEIEMRQQNWVMVEMPWDRNEALKFIKTVDPDAAGMHSFVGVEANIDDDKRSMRLHFSFLKLADAMLFKLAHA